ncbi:hypothetical protein QZH41_003570 [Actinostola sp. cb2023]|nr:hypothetical protein QZH41_003570 [Actinostola sp. cb2023]
MADNSLNWKDEIGVEFEPPSVKADVPLSSLSPAHSMDSGFDNEMNFLAEFDAMDFGMMESILNADINANLSNHKQETQTSKAKPKAMEEMSELEKSRKSAQAARDNRLKKKKYVEGMETEIEQLRKDNEALKARDRRHTQAVEKLEDEVSYLRNVLANQSTLSTLMKRLVSTPGISFTSNFSEEEIERSSPVHHDDDDANHTDDEDDDNYESEPQSEKCKKKVQNFIQTRYQTRGTKRSASAGSSSSARKKARKDVKGGVCLHVSQDMISLAFCSQCSIKVSANTPN